MPWPLARERAGVADLLVATLNRPPAIALDPGWAAITADALVAASLEHRIAPAVFLYVRHASDLPDAWAQPLEHLYRDQLIRHLRTEADLKWLAGVLEPLTVDWVTFKGPVLSDRLWPRPDMRQYYDLDALVDRHAFGSVLTALTGAGAQLLDRNWPLIARQMRAELTLVLPNGTSLDLHWDLVNDAATRHQLKIPTATMLRRRVEVGLGALRVPTFDPTDTLLHLTMHAAHAGANRLLWLKDIHCAATADGLDWAELTRRARYAGLELTATIVLQRTADVLDRELLADARAWHPRRGPWPAAAELAARTFPPPHLPGRGHTGQLLFRCVRRGGADSAAAAVRYLVRPPRSLGDGPGNPLHVDRPDEPARSRYLRAVENDATP